MINGLRGATIWSEDLNKLLPFYRDLLALPVAIQMPGFVVLGERGAPTLALGPTDYGQLRIATLKDPEGNMIQLLQPIAG